MVASAGCVLVGSWIRVVATIMIKDPAQYGTTLLQCMHAAQFLSDCGGPVAMGAVSRLSQVWFPAQQRSLATAISTESNMLGVALAFLWGPGMFGRAERAEALGLWWSLAIPATLVFLLAVFTFPERPATPPSESARVQRIASVRGHGGLGDAVREQEEEEEEEDEQQQQQQHRRLLQAEEAEAREEKEEQGGAPAQHHTGWWGRARESLAMGWALASNFNFCVLALGYGVVTGIYGAWAAVLAINLETVDVSQNLAGWIGFAATVGGCVAGLVSGHLLERLRQGKWVLIALITASGVSFLAFAIITAVRHNAIHSPEHGTHLGHDTWVTGDDALVLLFLFATLGGFFCTATIPAFYEIAAETAYPLDQGFIGTMLANFNNLFCLAFLVVPVSTIGTRWENWTMAGVCFATVVAFVFLFQEVQKRRQVDEGAKSLALPPADQHPASPLRVVSLTPSVQ